MTFSYHRSVAPMMWILVAIATVETLVVHLLVALWRPWVAALLSVVSVATIFWLIGAIRSFKTLPVEISDGQLVWRVGRLRKVVVPLDRVSTLKTE
jgi:membrane protein YdbS with pleckstrin-like domain